MAGPTPRRDRVASDVEALRGPLTESTLRGWFAEARATGADVSPALRLMKHRAFLRTTVQDVALDAPVRDVCRALSLVAQVAIDLATAHALEAVAERDGPPLDTAGRPIPFCVVGMGKLGGRELNYSSDVDLIYFYGTDDGAAGEVTPHAHFRRVCEHVSRLVGEATSEGFVFRVDLRLRPEGGGGPLCNSLAGAERYYESWGRTWERVAWLRARHVGGDPGLTRRLLNTLAPWIHQRTRSGALLGEIAALKERILGRRRAAVATRRAPGLDLKLDRGCIRSVEFFVNALQLVHAGRNPTLRDASTLGALDRLFAAGHVGEQERDALAEAYTLFRRVEHRVQMEDERQTQRLPGGDALEDLARRLGVASGGALQALLDIHRERVADLFDSLTGSGDGPREPSDAARELAQALLSTGEPDARRALFTEAGFADPDQAVHLLLQAGRPPESPFSPRAAVAMEALGVVLLAEVLRAAEPERALTHLAGFAAGLSSRPTYLHALADRPALRRLLVSVFAGSDFLSELLLRRAQLLDELYGTPSSDALPPLEGDAERCLEDLARFKQTRVFRIGLADLAGELDEVGVGHEITGVAEVVLQRALDLARREVSERFGIPEDAAGRPIPMCVLAFGKLGGREMSYGSDLDVVFLYAAAGESTGGRSGRRLEMLAWATRVAQRTISLLGLPTRFGPLFAVDTRLRPGGGQGTLVSRLGRFVEYHEVRGRAWERLALVRARPVAGEPGFCARVAAETARLAFERPSPPELRREVAEVRARMEREVAREGAGRYNPKTGRGGLVDIEFIAQVLQIERATATSTLRTTHTLEALTALGDAGLLPSAQRLSEAWRFLRRLDHRLRIMRGQAVVELRTEQLDRLSRRLGYQGAGPADASPGDRLMLDYERTTRAVRACFDEIFEENDGPSI